MPEPNATPAPLELNDIQEGGLRIYLAQTGGVCSNGDARAILRLLDATRAKLAEEEASYRSANADALAAIIECDSLRAKLAEAEAQRDALLTQTGMEPNVWEAAKALAESHCRAVGNIDVSRLSDKLTAAESRVAALEAALTEIASFGEGAEVNSTFDEPHSARTARAALSPSQDAKGGA